MDKISSITIVLNGIATTYHVGQGDINGKRINRFVNAPVKEGYLKSIEILKTLQTDITRAKLEELKTVQGRAIAALAIDYLNGECTQYVLLGVPIKDR